MAEEKKKICPLTYTLGKGAYDQESADFDYCVKEQCEWWIVGLGGISIGACSRRVLAENLFFIQEHLKQRRE